MKKMLYASIITAAVVISAAIVLTCNTYDEVNPVDTAYKGDYALEINMGDLPDTIAAFRPYVLEYTIGADTFSDIRVRNTAPPLDTLVFRNALTDSTITLYFTAPFSGNLYITGVRPNNKEVIDTLNVFVVNPFGVRGDTLVAAGEPGTFYIARSDTAAGKGASAVWFAGADAADSTAIDSAVVLAFDVAGTVTVRARIADTFGNALFADSLLVRSGGYFPEIVAAALPSTAFIGDTLGLAIRVGDGDDDSVAVTLVCGGDTLAHGILVPANTEDTVVVSAASAVLDTGRLSWHAVVVDRDGHEARTADGAIRIQYVLPACRFPESAMEAAFGDTIRFEVSDTTSAATDVFWSSKFFGDTLLPFGAFLECMYPSTVADTIRDTITAAGIDRFGLRGRMDTLVVTARDYDFLVTLVRPAEVWAGRPAVWHAAARSPRGLVMTDVRYVWACEGADTVFSGTDSLAALFGSGATGVVSVFAVVNGTDTTQQAVSRVTALQHRPLCDAVGPVAFDAVLGQVIVCRVSARDVNEDGAVAGIVWMEDDGNPRAGGPHDTAYEYGCPYPGPHVVSAWAIDDDGFASDTVLFAFDVSADRPVIGALKAPGVIYVLRAVTLELTYYNAPDRAPVNRFLWDFDGDTLSWDAETALPSYRHTFADTGWFEIIAACVDGDGARSDAGVFPLYVDVGRPRVLDISPDTVFVHAAAPCTVRAVDNEQVARYRLSIDGGETFAGPQADSVFVVTFDTPGTAVRAAIATDNIQMESPVYYDTVFVRAAPPVIDSFAFAGSAGSFYCGDEAAFSFCAHDTNGVIATFYVCLDGAPIDTIEPAAPSSKACGGSSIELSFGMIGTRALRLVAIDDHGFADTLDTTFQVLDGSPSIDSLKIARPSGTIYAGDTILAAFGAHDVNGVIAAYRLFLDNRLVENREAALPFLHDTIAVALDRAAAGTRTLRLVVVDNHGFADTLDREFMVTDGAPVITGVTFDTAGGLFAGKPFGVTIHAEDPNGTLPLSYGIDYTGNGVDDATGSSPSFNVTVSQGGELDMRVRVVDNENLADTLVLPEFVRWGYPVIDSVSPSLAWINDHFLVYAHDTAGSIMRYYYDMDGGGSWNDSNHTGRFLFTVADTPRTTVRVGARDTHGFVSSATFGVTVRAGRPTLAFSADTLFLPTRGANEDSTRLWDDSIRITVGASDPNGTVNDFNWTLAWDKVALPVVYHGTTPTLTIYVPDSLVDTKCHLLVVGTDDDGMSGTAKTVVWADGPPPPPIYPYPTSSAYLNADKDSVTIIWDHFDVIDGPLAQYRFQAVVRRPTDVEPYYTIVKSAYIIYSFTPLTDLNPETTEYSCTVKLPFPTYLISGYAVYSGIDYWNYCTEADNLLIYGWARDRHGRVSQPEAIMAPKYGWYLCPE